MRTLARLVSVVSLLAVGMLMMPGAAQAADPVVPQAEYEAAYAAASTAAGVFASGTTVSIELTSADGDIDLLVNPNGSLVGERRTDGTTTRIRCVRVDRCWEQAAESFGDMKWHRLPVGSVTYQLGRDYWSTWRGFPWPADARYGLATSDDGTPIYIVAFSVKGMSIANVDEFQGAATRSVSFLVVDESMSELASGIYTAIAEPTPVVPPARKWVGAPATQLDAWTVPINN